MPEILKDPNNRMPRRAYCCAHDTACAVHSQPYDGEFVRCTCKEPATWAPIAGWGRHEREVPDPQLVAGPESTQ
jgi:hypothetical protein